LNVSMDSWTKSMVASAGVCGLHKTRSVQPMICGSD
jgi:hypothetical protein